MEEIAPNAEPYHTHDEDLRNPNTGIAIPLEERLREEAQKLTMRALNEGVVLEFTD